MLTFFPHVLQTEVAVEAEDLKMSKQKMQRRIGELKEDLSREVSLRASLEESHSTLLERVQDMEGIVSQEQHDVRHFTWQHHFQA